MNNPQDNPRTPPPPIPSNSSTPPLPSTSPKLRLKRVKILARKTVASGALRKKLKRVEQSGKKSGGSGSGEAAEGLVNLSTQGDEPGSSTEETLADLLKKAGSESDLQKDLAESKKKKLTKGKGKVTESQRLWRLRRWNKSIMRKFNQWSGEEVEDDSDSEQDKLSTFGKRKILKGRLLKDLVEQGMMRLVDALAAQGWKDMVLQMDDRLARNEIIKFMTNVEVQDGKVSSLMKGVQVSFEAEKLGEILDIPSEGFDDYTRQRWPCLDSLPTALEITRRFCDAEDVNEARAVQKSEMRPQHKVLFEFVNKCLFPRQERRHIANYMNLVLMECLESGRQINWPAFIIKLLDRVINGSKAHATPYGFILTTIMDRFNMPMKKWEMASSKDHFGINTLIVCDYLVSAIPNEPGSSKKTSINSKVRALVQECEAKDAEIARFKARVVEVESEMDALGTELTKENEKNDGILHNMLNLLQA
uniref:Putative plant transposon protein domain-containing protein n=1 Tax=Nicotiana tabacum TaxID=4097 RepID=A0A1S3Z5F2_TOBAC|nr:PREDICTED: uncharacterized protein LOC107783122 [Nicotiana tabacum]